MQRTPIGALDGVAVVGRSVGSVGSLMQMGTINIQQVTKSRGRSDAQKQSAFIPDLSSQLFLSKKGNIPAQWHHVAVCISLSPFFHLFSFMQCGLLGVG